ncbi:MAG: hypothetical protein ABI615_12435 [Chthoniobacterales bacterium]
MANFQDRLPVLRELDFAAHIPSVRCNARHGAIADPSNSFARLVFRSDKANAVKRNFSNASPIHPEDGREIPLDYKKDEGDPA